MTAEPQFSSLPPASSESYLTFLAGKEPGGGIAKALATVIAPAAGPPGDVLFGQFPLAPFGGPPGLAPRPRPPFAREKGLPCQPPGISQPYPDKMEDLMPDDTVVVLFQGAIEDDEALADEGGGVGGISGRIAQANPAANFDGPADQQGVHSRTTVAMVMILWSMANPVPSSTFSISKSTGSSPGR